MIEQTIPEDGYGQPRAIDRRSFVDRNGESGGAHHAKHDVTLGQVFKSVPLVFHFVLGSLNGLGLMLRLKLYVSNVPRPKADLDQNQSATRWPRHMDTIFAKQKWHPDEIQCRVVLQRYNAWDSIPTTHWLGSVPMVV